MCYRMKRGGFLTTSLTLVLLLLPVTVKGDATVSTFTSASLPPQGSQVVQDVKQELERLVKVDLLIEDLRKLENSVADVRKQMNAYGTVQLKENADIVIDGMNSLKVQSTNTFELFNSQSETALGKLHSALDHLVRGEMAKVDSDMGSIADVIGQLTTSASDLSSKSHAAKQKVVGLVTDVGATLDAQQQEKERYMQQERQLQGELAELNQKVKNARDAAEKAKREAEAAKQEALKQKKKLKKKRKKLFGLGGVVMDVLDDGFNIELHKPYTERRKQAERQQQAFEAQAAKQRQFAQQAESQRADLEAKKKSVDDTISRIIATKDSLSKASQEITELAWITADLTTFWKTMKESIQELTQSTSIANDVSRAADGVVETEILQSRPFQMKFVQFHSKWMALKLVSSSYLSHFKIRRDEL